MTLTRDAVCFILCCERGLAAFEYPLSPAPAACYLQWQV